MVDSMSKYMTNSLFSDFQGLVVINFELKWLTIQTSHITVTKFNFTLISKLTSWHSTSYKSTFYKFHLTVIKRLSSGEYKFNWEISNFNSISSAATCGKQKQSCPKYTCYSQLSTDFNFYRGTVETMKTRTYKL